MANQMQKVILNKLCVDRLKYSEYFFYYKYIAQNSEKCDDNKDMQKNNELCQEAVDIKKKGLT